MKLIHAGYYSDAVTLVMATMCDLKVTCSKPRVLSEGSPTSDVTGIINYGGELVGSMVLSLPEDVARKIVPCMGITTTTTRSPEFLDAIGELTNMVAGQAKARFVGYDAMISIPTVVCGRDHHVNRRQRCPWVVIGCQCTQGGFVVAASLVEKKK